MCLVADRVARDLNLRQAPRADRIGCAPVADQAPQRGRAARRAARPHEAAQAIAQPTQEDRHRQDRRPTDRLREPTWLCRASPQTPRARAQPWRARRAAQGAVPGRSDWRRAAAIDPSRCAERLRPPPLDWPNRSPGRWPASKLRRPKQLELQGPPPADPPRCLPAWNGDRFDFRVLLPPPADPPRCLALELPPQASRPPLPPPADPLHCLRRGRPRLDRPRLVPPRSGRPRLGSPRSHAPPPADPLRCLARGRPWPPAHRRARRCQRCRLASAALASRAHQRLPSLPCGRRVRPACCCPQGEEAAAGEASLPPWRPSPSRGAARWLRFAAAWKAARLAGLQGTGRSLRFAVPPGAAPGRSDRTWDSASACRPAAGGESRPGRRRCTTRIEPQASEPLSRRLAP